MTHFTVSQKWPWLLKNQQPSGFEQPCKQLCSVTSVASKNGCLRAAIFFGQYVGARVFYIINIIKPHK